MQASLLKVTPEIREALLASALPGDEAKPFPVIGDWPSLVYAAHVHGLLPLVADRVRASDYPADAKRAFIGHRLSYSGRLKQLERYLARVLNALGDAHVPALVLKGPALANSIYPDPMQRPYGDLDVVCREEDWQAAHATLLSLGFEPKDGDGTPPPKVWERKAYYHTQYHLKEADILVEVHYDLWQIGLRPRLGQLFWDRSRPVEIAGADARMLAPEDQVLHLCVHLHHHGYKRLIWFSDLAVLVHAIPDLDWRAVISAAREEGVGASVYYALGYLEELLGVAVPAWVRAELRPSPLQALLHQHLWPRQAILDLEIDDTVSCGEFHEVPEATELLSNMILSGRRLEKAAYLLRLLLPSTRWLAYYYGTDDPAALRVRRLVHGPKLVLRAFGELGAAVVRALRGERWVPEHALNGAD